MFLLDDLTVGIIAGVACFLIPSSFFTFGSSDQDYEPMTKWTAKSQSGEERKQR